MADIKTLEEQLAAIQKQIEREKKKAVIIEKIKAMAEHEGYTIEELFAGASVGGGERKSRKPKAKAVYQNPENKRQDWSGPEAQPNKPQWVIDYEAAGGNIEDCRIPGR